MGVIIELNAKERLTAAETLEKAARMVDFDAIIIIGWEKESDDMHTFTSAGITYAEFVYAMEVCKADAIASA